MESDPARPSRLTQPLAITLLCVAAVCAVAAVALPVQQLLIGDAAAALDLDPSGSERALGAVTGLPSGTSLSPPFTGVTVTVTATAAPDGGTIPVYLRVLTDLGTSVWLAATAAGCLLLAGILGNIAAGRPFHANNSKHLRWIAVAIVIGSAGAETINWAAARSLVEFLDLQPPLVAVPYYSLPPLLLAALVAVLASAFSRGRALAEDVEGLV